MPKDSSKTTPKSTTRDTRIDQLFDQIAELAQKPEWFQKAKCWGMGNDFFFPNKGTLSREQKEFCAECPTRAECLDYGINIRFGIYGGTSERQRRVLRKNYSPAKRDAFLAEN